MAIALDPFAPDSLEDPYGLYETLQREQPVFELEQTGIWLVTRHADLVEAVSKPETFSSHISAIVYAGQGNNPAVIAADPDAIGAVDVLATQDPPVHTRQRRLMNKWLTRARILALRSQIETFVDDALTRALREGRIEWMEDLANPLPVIVISRLLGMPDLEELKRWADAGVDLLSGVAPPERMLECWQDMTHFLAYLRARLLNPEPDTITADIGEAVHREDLTEREGVSLLLQLVIAGSESTASLMGSAARILADDRKLQDSLRADASMIGAFLEEALRLESPFRGHFRVTTKATTLGGVELPEGARVMLMWGAANRDPAAFDRPDEVDCARPHIKGHVAFGSGIHFCIGAPLARLEAGIAIGGLLAHTKQFQRVEQPRHVPSLFVRRLERLDLRLS